MLEAGHQIQPTLKGRGINLYLLRGKYLRIVDTFLKLPQRAVVLVSFVEKIILSLLNCLLVKLSFYLCQKLSKCMWVYFWAVILFNKLDNFIAKATY